MSRKDVVVVGGGAAGLCSAIYLMGTGRHVTVLDPGRTGSASTGNAGMIVPSHIIPLSSPGVIRMGIRWLTDRESPLYIKPRLSRDLLAWLLRFRRACTEEHVRASIPVLRDLSLASVELLEQLAERPGMKRAAYINSGILMLYHSEKGREENLEAADLAEAAGLDVARLNRSDVLRLDPGIKSDLEGGILYRQDGRVDPNGLLSALQGEAQRLGADIESNASVTGFETGGDAVTAVLTSNGRTVAREVVITAGAWSADLARMLGTRLLLEPAKGYSITVPAPDSKVSVPHILTEDKLTVTPMPGRIRFAGTLSLSGFDDRVDDMRTAPIRRLARTYLSGSADVPEVWFGYRPCSPDGLPYIGRDQHYANVTYATGHGMLGITHAPITGKLVAEIITGQTPSVDIAALAPNR